VVVAFSNVASLWLVRVEARRREFAVRSTLGASTSRIWWSLAAEMGIVSGVGGLLGLVLAVAGLTLLVRSGPADLPRLAEVRPDWLLFASALGLTVAFCLAGALIGTWRLTGTDMIRALRDGGRGGTGGTASQRMRAVFVLVEVALSLVLLSGSAVLGRSLERLRAIQPGFNPENLFTFRTFLPPLQYSTPATIARFYGEAADRIGRLPGVESAGVVSKLPLVGGSTGRLVWVEDSPRPEDALPPSATIASASSGYFGAMQIPMLAGRSFDVASVSRGQHEVVVTRRFVSEYLNDSVPNRALGRRVRPGRNGPWYTIVGVAGDVRDTSLTIPPASALYFPQHAGSDSTADWQTADWRGNSEMTFVVRTRGAAAGLPALLAREIHALDPKLPLYQPAFMEQMVADSGSRMTFALLLLGAGAVVTLALGVVGLYGVIAYVVGMRSREIAIRVALGLTPRKAARMILGQGEVIIIVGTVAGLLAFAAFARLLSSLAFEVSVLDRPALAASAAVVLAVATLATWIPALRASRINPADVLKNE
jgi:predicted permease